MMRVTHFLSAFRKRCARRGLTIGALLLLFTPGLACGDDDGERVQSRGVGNLASPIKSGKGKSKNAKSEEDSASKRVSKILVREDFGADARDPFQRVHDLEEEVVVETTKIDRQREVKMPNYTFEELKLVAIVVASKNVRGRALFVAQDGRSQTIHQGEIFSRSELMLASVNRDYIEVEVVDEELAKGLNLQRGERRAIYLRHE